MGQNINNKGIKFYKSCKKNYDFCKVYLSKK